MLEVNKVKVTVAACKPSGKLVKCLQGIARNCKECNIAYGSGVPVTLVNVVGVCTASIAERLWQEGMPTGKLTGVQGSGRKPAPSAYESRYAMGPVQHRCSHQTKHIKGQHSCMPQNS